MNKKSIVMIIAVVLIFLVALLIAVLLFKPNGMFGEKLTEKV